MQQAELLALMDWSILHWASMRLLCAVALQASAFVLFPDLKSACNAVLPLKQSKVAVAVELHDYSSLRLAELPLQNLVPQLTTAQEGAAALLIQVKGESAQDLADTIKKAQAALNGSGAKFGGQPEKPFGVESYPFSTDPRVRATACRQLLASNKAWL